MALAMTFAVAQAFDDAKYPDMKGQWNRVGPPNWQAVNGPAPLTPEYQAVYNANRADMTNGGPGDVPSWYCLPQGMPMVSWLPNHHDQGLVGSLLLSVFLAGTCYAMTPASFVQQTISANFA